MLDDPVGIGLLFVLLLVLGVMHYLTVKRMEATQSLREASWLDERQTLLTRIQHPERIPVLPERVIEHDQPRDMAEMAFIGSVVPDGYQVGTVTDE